jgi:hypothetical protein
LRMQSLKQVQPIAPECFRTATNMTSDFKKAHDEISDTTKLGWIYFLCNTWLLHNKKKTRAVLLMDIQGNALTFVSRHVMSFIITLIYHRLTQAQAFAILFYTGTLWALVLVLF